MRYVLVALAIVAAGCQFKAPSNPDEQPTLPHAASWPKDGTELTRCLQKHHRISECTGMGPTQQMHGVWYTGFEESGFVPNVGSVPLVREISVHIHNPEFDTLLEIDANAALRRIGQPSTDPCTRAVAIEFIGRRSVKPGPYYASDDGHAVVVDRLLSARLIGKVRDRVNGRDRRC